MILGDHLAALADELRRRFAEYDEVPASVQAFLETAIRARWAWAWIDNQDVARAISVGKPFFCRIFGTTFGF